MGEHDEIGAYEAKTRLPEFLRRVRAGGRFTITQRGKPIAELLPVQTGQRRRAVEAARRMRAFVNKHPPVSGVDTRALIDEGRD